MIVTEPVATAVTSPAAVTVAVPVALLLHVPPLTPSDREVVVPVHIVTAPVIVPAFGSALMVSMLDALVVPHPLVTE